jgi:hypothetical protein
MKDKQQPCVRLIDSRLAVLAVLACLLWGGPSFAGEDKDRVAIKTAKDHIDFLVGDELVGRYHIGADIAKPYFWPLKVPGGTVITRGWPMEPAPEGGSKDHPHQKSAWFCHGDVIPEGIELKQKIKGVKGVDFWSEAKGHGRIVCVKVDNPKVDKDHAQITTYNEWRTADGVKIMDEVRTIHLYRINGAWLLVFEIDLDASVTAIVFGDTKEGAMGIRISDQITGEKREGKKTVPGAGTIENSRGKKGEKECWGQVATWCDYSGPIDGKKVGLAILDDPGNPHPACWHSRGYGLMAANPFGREESRFPAVKNRKDLVGLAKGEHLRLRYGILLHTGDAREGRVAESYDRFVKLRK